MKKLIGFMCVVMLSGCATGFQVMDRIDPVTGTKSITTHFNRLETRDGSNLSFDLMKIEKTATMSLLYSGRSWAFIDNLTFNADGEVIRFEREKREPNNSVTDRGVIEIVSFIYDKKKLNKIANGKMSLAGREGVRDLINNSLPYSPEKLLSKSDSFIDAGIIDSLSFIFTTHLFRCFLFSKAVIRLNFCMV